MPFLQLEAGKINDVFEEIPDPVQGAPSYLYEEVSESNLEPIIENRYGHIVFDYIDGQILLNSQRFKDLELQRLRPIKLKEIEEQFLSDIKEYEFADGKIYEISLDHWKFLEVTVDAAERNGVEGVVIYDIGHDRVFMDLKSVIDLMLGIAASYQVQLDHYKELVRQALGAQTLEELSAVVYDF